MPRRCRARRDNVEVRRDLNNIWQFTINIAAGVSEFPICRWIRDLRQKSELIEELETKLQKRDLEINELKTQYELKLAKLKQDFDRRLDGGNRAIQALKGVRKQMMRQDILDIDLDLQKINETLTSAEYARACKACINAAIWVSENKEEWIERTVTESISKNSNLLDTSEKIKTFSQNISNYLDWLYESLLCAIELDTYKFVDSKTLCSPFLYREAFYFIKISIDHKKLLPEESSYLLETIDYLIETF